MQTIKPSRQMNGWMGRETDKLGRGSWRIASVFQTCWLAEPSKDKSVKEAVKKFRQLPGK